MFSKTLIAFTAVGLIAGLVFGVYLIDVKNTNQLVFVEGVSLSIVTEKFNFKKGEEIKISIINSGTVPLTFSDSSYGLRITGLSGMLLYTPEGFQDVNSQRPSLVPKEEIEFYWNQIKNDGDPILEGLYKIHSKGFDPEENNIEKSTTITIWK
ncbi:MAG TPA: hypothetical protein VMW55_10365 [Nitrosopumilaceae archaeon]|nr:hypothetical protein [Nitrosopumilaceae archaeon]